MVKARNSIESRARLRGITRLCHFTPSRNLGHIVHDSRGLLASEHLLEDNVSVFNPTDRERIDGHRGHVCCSVQYPNAWYFRSARNKEQIFPDWVVLLLSPHYLWQEGTKFCQRNAATAHGQLVREGLDAFDALFDKVVEGSQTYRRGSLHPDFLPTDEQAEILIPDRVERSDVLGIAVQSKAQRKRELVRIELMGMNAPTLLVVPEFYDPERLSQMLRNGHVPNEVIVDKGGANVE